MGPHWVNSRAGTLTASEGLTGQNPLPAKPFKGLYFQCCELCASSLAVWRPFCWPPGWP